MKICIKCSFQGEILQFVKNRNVCLECKRKYNKQYRELNQDYYKVYKQEYYQVNKIELSHNQKLYNIEHKIQNTKTII